MKKIDATHYRKAHYSQSAASKRIFFSLYTWRHVRHEKFWEIIQSVQRFVQNFYWNFQPLSWDLVFLTNFTVQQFLTSVSENRGQIMTDAIGRLSLKKCPETKKLSVSFDEVMSIRDLRSKRTILIQKSSKLERWVKSYESRSEWSSLFRQHRHLK